jgi:hypothetical protein
MVLLRICNHTEFLTSRRVGKNPSNTKTNVPLTALVRFELFDKLSTFKIVYDLKYNEECSPLMITVRVWLDLGWMLIVPACITFRSL